MAQPPSISSKFAPKRSLDTYPTSLDPTSIDANLHHPNPHNRQLARNYQRKRQDEPIQRSPTYSDLLREERGNRRNSPFRKMMRKLRPWVTLVAVLAAVETILILMLTVKKKTAARVGATACVVVMVIAGLFARRLWKRQGEDRKSVV